MGRIKKFFKRFDDEMAAVAFAEAGELEMAKELLAESDNKIEEKRGYGDDGQDKGLGVVIPIRPDIKIPKQINTK